LLYGGEKCPLTEYLRGKIRAVEFNYLRYLQVTRNRMKNEILHEETGVTSLVIRNLEN
jgi:hypothetical protein